MDKVTIYISIIWIVLALASFIGAFWCPIVPKIIGIVFGLINMYVAVAMLAAIKGSEKQ